MNRALVKGWCPGALRPMESGDGLVVRLKPTGGIVPTGLAAKIADWSARWGNGQIDLTSRANLQLRGVTVDGLPVLQSAMAEAELLDASPDGEAVRNVVASPLAGVDPDAILDIRPVVAKLEARLAGDPRLHALPSKFGAAVDDGGRVGPGDVPADIRFEARSTADGPIFEIHLDGEDGGEISFCKPDEVPEVAASLGYAMLAQSGLSRKRARGSGRGVHPATSLKRGIELGVRRLNRAPFPGMSAAFLGLGLPFGRVSTEALASLAKSAESHGASELRLASWRAILVPMPTVDATQRLAAGLSSADFILDDGDPRRSIAACVGSPACSRATTDTRADASRMAGTAAGAAILHVSGCSKGCAHPRPAAITLVGRNGLYDLVCNGAAWDQPCRTGMSATEAAEQARLITAGAMA
jgi:precorrin-3B synthase